MGQFSWLDCKTREQVLDDVERDVFVLIPQEFGGGHLKESCYDGYGHFGGRDVYALVAGWNMPESITGNDEEDRLLGIEIACYDKDNRALKYPIKITHDPLAIYEDCEPSDGDPDQGWIVDEEEDWEDEEEEDE